jgi:hypothetical protein
VSTVPEPTIKSAVAEPVSETAEEDVVPPLKKANTIIKPPKPVRAASSAQSFAKLPLQSGVPCTAELTACIRECEAAVDAVLAGLADGEKFTDGAWPTGPSMLYTDGAAPSHDCTVAVPSGYKRLSEMSDEPVLIASIDAGDVRDGLLAMACDGCSSPHPPSTPSVHTAAAAVRSHIISPRHSHHVAGAPRPAGRLLPPLRDRGGGGQAA